MARFSAKLAEAAEKIIPATPEEMQRAKKADLITLPENVKGTNCSNCRFVKLPEKECLHPQVKQKVSERMCCAFWDAEGVFRAWENKDSGE